MDARALASVRFDAALFRHVLVVLTRTGGASAVALLPVCGHRRDGRRRLDCQSSGRVRSRCPRPAARWTSARRTGVVGLRRSIVLTAGAKAALRTWRSSRCRGGSERRADAADAAAVKGVDHRNVERVEAERVRRRRRGVVHAARRLPDLGVDGRRRRVVRVVVVAALDVAVRRTDAADAEVRRSATRFRHLALVAASSRTVFRHLCRRRRDHIRLGRRRLGAARPSLVAIRRHLSVDCSWRGVNDRLLSNSPYHGTRHDTRSQV